MHQDRIDAAVQTVGTKRVIAIPHGHTRGLSLSIRDGTHENHLRGTVENRLDNTGNKQVDDDAGKQATGTQQDDVSL